MPSWLIPASRQRSRCASTISRATRADVLVADARVVLALRRREAAARREAERSALDVEEVLLLEAEPRVRVVRDRRAAVARMRRPVGQEHLAHHEGAVLAGRVGEDRDRLEHAVGVAAVRLPRRAAVEAPERELLERREPVELHDLRLAPQVRNGLVAVEPDVLELELLHQIILPVAGAATVRAPEPARSHRLTTPVVEHEKSAKKSPRALKEL